MQTRTGTITRGQKVGVLRALGALLLVGAVCGQLGVAPAPNGRVVAYAQEEVTATPTTETPLPELEPSLTPEHQECYALALSVVVGEGTVMALTPENCDGGYGAGTIVSLQAGPAEGLVLLGWSGTDDDSSPAPQNQVTVSAAIEVSVAFGEQPTPEISTSPTPESQACYPLTLSVASGEGTITAQTPENCDGGYLPGTTVELVATPVAGYRVSAWLGTDDDSLQASRNTTTVHAPSAVQIMFERLAGALQVVGTDDRVRVAESHDMTAVPYPMIALLSIDWGTKGGGVRDGLPVPEQSSRPATVYMTRTWDGHGLWSSCLGEMETRRRRRDGQSSSAHLGRGEPGRQMGIVAWTPPAQHAMIFARRPAIRRMQDATTGR